MGADGRSDRVEHIDSEGRGGERVHRIHTQIRREAKEVQLAVGAQCQLDSADLAAIAREAYERRVARGGPARLHIKRQRAPIAVAQDQRSGGDEPIVRWTMKNERLGLQRGG